MDWEKNCGNIYLIIFFIFLFFDKGNWSIWIQIDYKYR